MLLEKVLVALDFTESSLEAARWTAQHLAPKAELLLAHCVDAPALPGFLSSSVPHLDQLIETLRVGAEKRLEEFMGTLGSARIRSTVCTGRVHERICELAVDVDADLVVIGPHEEGPGLGKLLAGVPEKLIRACTAPVLLARSLPSGPPRTVLVPMDGSPAALRALDCGLAIAGQHKAQVLLLHSVSNWYADKLRWVSAEKQAEGLIETQMAQARTWFEELLHKLGSQPVQIRAEVVAGPPDLEILAAAGRHDASLVVMGSRGDGGRPLLGSVAHSLLHHGQHATCFVSEPLPL
jgi:nucleotide-binding universal stress UspA family protein